jgi:hypothetical protein
MLDQNTSIVFTAFYCEHHGQGCLVEGEHTEAPAWISNVCGDGCQGWWEFHGFIRADGTNSLPSQAVYDSLGDGWQLGYYYSTLYNRYGNPM